MPVILPPEELDGVAPQPPRPIVWLAVFVVFMIAFVVGGLLTWPKGEPTSSAWFWIRLLGLPALVWCVLFGLRLHYYDDETAHREAKMELRQQDRNKAIEFASEPLAVLGYAFLSAAGEGSLSEHVLNGNTLLSARKPGAGKDAVRHTVLDNDEGTALLDRYRRCFEKLLEQMSGTLDAVPHDTPLAVGLHVPAGEEQSDILAIWSACWKSKRSRHAAAELIQTEQGVMMLDEWLDIWGGPSLEKFMLFVSAQLHVTSPPESGEAAVALLLGWAPLAERRDMPSLALLHRPIVADMAEPREGISKALLWGGAQAQQVNDLWQAALEREDKTTLLKCASGLSLGISHTSGFPGVHDIDTVIGTAGVCSGWLAIGLGAVRASSAGAPQLIVWREGSLRIAVIQPVLREEVEVTA
ncbi:MAG TPA: hypothetical protein VGM85_13025 [Paraburkholderia sp.]|jgi:hypothetical protein